jgi:DNA-binding NtrC family response regulator
MPNDILIVDDEADIRDLVAGILDDEGFLKQLAPAASVLNTSRHRAKMI